MTNWLRTGLLILSLFAMVPSVTQASGYANGTVSGNYTYRDGYWWSNGVAFTRTRQAYYTTGYCSSRRCSTRSLAYRWVYRRSSYQPAVQPQYVTPKTEGWRTKLLEIAATRDRYEASTRASANEHNEFIEAVEALGLTSNFTWRGLNRDPRLRVTTSMSPTFTETWTSRRYMNKHFVTVVPHVRWNPRLLRRLTNCLTDLGKGPARLRRSKLNPRPCRRPCVNCEVCWTRCDPSPVPESRSENTRCRPQVRQRTRRMLSPRRVRVIP